MVILPLPYNHHDDASRLTVPIVDVRKRVPDSVIRALARRIAEKFKPKTDYPVRVVCAGQPAPRKRRVDMLAILDTADRESDKSLEIRRALGISFGLDLIVCTPKHLKERLKMGDWFLRDALEEGKVLYEARSR